MDKNNFNTIAIIIIIIIAIAYPEFIVLQAPFLAYHKY